VDVRTREFAWRLEGPPVPRPDLVNALECAKSALVHQELTLVVPRERIVRARGDLRGLDGGHPGR
jgi:hypothetical protein